MTPRWHLSLLVSLLVLAACSGDGTSKPPQPERTALSSTRRGRLVPVHPDVALDPRTNLEWTRHDHEQSLAWPEADQYCKSLTAGERSGWRLPEIGELVALYDAKLAVPCGDRTCRIDESIRLGGPYVWSASERGPGTRFYFDAGYGTTFSPGIDPRLVRRVICVRGAVSRQPTPPAP